MKKEHQIYTLSSSEFPGAVRYVGRTGETLKRRRTRHLSQRKESNCYRANWISSVCNNKKELLINLVENGLTLEESKEREKHYIKLFKSFSARLTNGTEGGDGGEGHKHTEEHRRYMSRVMKGKIRSKEHCKNISKSLIGRKLSEEHKETLRKSTEKAIKEGRIPKNYHKKLMRSSVEACRKTVIQYDLEGNFIKEWYSASEAGRALGTGGNAICGVCNTKNNRKTHRGFMWKYKN